MKLVGVASPRGAEPPPGAGHPEDVDLMRLAAAEDPRAQRLVVARLAPRGLRIARALVSHAEDAKDVAQEGLLEVLRSAGSYRGEASLERWAERIFVRRSMRFVHRVRDPRAAREVLVDAADLERHDDGVSSSILRQMDEHVARLPDELQRVLLLRFSLGYTVPEMAELTATSANTIKKRLMRAMERLRELVEREERR